MQPEERDAAHLWDLVQAADEIAECVRGLSLVQLMRSRLRLLALERALEILGESARRVSRSFQAAHPEIDWRRMIGQRNIIARQYGEIDHRWLFETATDFVPRDRAAIEAVMRTMEDDSAMRHTHAAS